MHSLRLIAAALISMVALASCSADEQTEAKEGVAGPSSPPAATPSAQESSSPQPAESEEPEAPIAPTVEVRVVGEQVAPNAAAIALGVGETLVFDISSDRAGELHVHSKPEQYVKFAAGATRAEITVHTPGTVEVEEHETSAVVAVLEVR
ncbi:hypothetical protein IEQ44_06350 [Nocardioides sp. Y6]|uniref:EfeO-type cupredoxin-like domain-containing protein n=1 Tax=Nocardioides malaquae TaxID=2773426 RepID=A0ABR9RRR6_9ACTN|nr:hypothetical protein [Nocardioides malaquae]MBE7324267.1 hypothetical protein [Nocardioides malaquae]